MLRDTGPIIFLFIGSWINVAGLDEMTSVGMPHQRGPRSMVCLAAQVNHRTRSLQSLDHPTGHLHVRSVSSISPIFLAFFSTSLTLASASGLISFADGWGGKG